MTTRSMAQVIRKAADAGDQRTLEERVAHWERALVGQLARITHAAGERFFGWPEGVLIDEDDNQVTLVVEVETEPRS